MTTHLKNLLLKILTKKKNLELEKLLGDDDDKGMAAIALSEAIGTPGTIADKAAVLNKSLTRHYGW